jgi:two-component system chemotaxis response regulator CheB
MKKIKVVIVEDSKLMQEILSRILSSDPDIEVAGIAEDPLIARDLIKKTNPDVLTLDIMLPHMDGLTFLKNLMRLRPMPTVMISTLTESGSALALEALALGAVDYLAKPTHDALNDLSKFEKELLTTVKNAANITFVKSVSSVVNNKLPETVFQSDLLKKELIVMGASTGGIEAIETILLQLPQVFPPILIVQHIKKEFSSAFANRIKRLYGLLILTPERDTEIVPGHIYIAPGERHLVIKKKMNRYEACLQDTPALNGHKPSIDELFMSAAQAAGKDVTGILLTGMGTDGAKGLRAIHDAGGVTIVQDEQSSVVWGMPGAAVKMGVVDFIVPLSAISTKLLQTLDAKMLGTTIS